MVYFFHHYELPVILQQAHFQQFLLRNTQQQREAGSNAAVAVPTSAAATIQQPRLQQITVLPIRARITQLISAVRPTATTQTSSLVVDQGTATSTGTITTSTVGTTAQPVSSSQSSQTVGNKKFSLLEI